MRVLIVGAGGHAQVVADILLCMRNANAEIVPVGYLDDDASLTGLSLLGLPVLGEIARLPAVPHDAVVVAIGDNVTRRRLFERLEKSGERFIVACHPNAVVAADVRIGPGTMICAGVVVNTGSVIGANVILNTGCTVDHHNRIGDHVHIAPGVHLGGGVTVGEGAMVGIGTTVIPRCGVGVWSVVGAGSVVTKDIPAGMKAIGAPARIIGRAQGDPDGEGGH